MTDEKTNAEANYHFQSGAEVDSAAAQNLFAELEKMAKEWPIAMSMLRNLAQQAEASEVSTAKQYLMSWREILASLELENKKENRDRVGRLNHQYDGPIVIEGRGAQPKVARDRLIVWWNDLENKWEQEQAVKQEQQQRERDRGATVHDNYNYGKQGRVFPELNGGIRNRRRTAKM